MPDIDDRWHALRPRPGVAPCADHASSKGPLYPTPRHGVGRRWAARWRDPAGRQRFRSFTRRADADRFLSGVLADMTRGEFIDPRDGRETFRAYATRWLAMQTHDPATRNATERRMRTQVFPTLGDVPLRALRPSTLQAWVAGLSRTHAPGTVRVTLSTVSTILGAAVEDGLIARNPARSSAIHLPAERRRQVTPWPVATVRAVADALPERYAAIVPACAGLGLRQGEVLALAVDAVDFLHREVHVTRQLKRVGSVMTYFAPPKGGKTRTVPLPEFVSLALADHLQRFSARPVTLPWLPTGQPVTVNLLFTADGRPVERTVFTRGSWRPALLAAGLEPTRQNGMHVLRHTYASVLLAQGIDVRLCRSAATRRSTARTRAGAGGA